MPRIGSRKPDVSADIAAGPAESRSDRHRRQIRSACHLGNANRRAGKHKRCERSSRYKNVFHFRSPNPVRRLRRAQVPVSPQLRHLRLWGSSKSIRLIVRFHIFIISFFATSSDFASLGSNCESDCPRFARSRPDFVRRTARFRPNRTASRGPPTSARRRANQRQKYFFFMAFLQQRRPPHLEILRRDRQPWRQDSRRGLLTRAASTMRTHRFSSTGCSATARWSRRPQTAHDKSCMATRAARAPARALARTRADRQCATSRPTIFFSYQNDRYRTDCAAGFQSRLTSLCGTSLAYAFCASTGDDG